MAEQDYYTAMRAMKAGAVAEEGEACPAATQSVEMNLANRQKAIDSANYGPANPQEPGDYWMQKAERMNAEEAGIKKMLCGNCAKFIITPKMLKCIESGIRADAEEVMIAGQIGFCAAFDFACAAKRTCDAWITGGPVMKES
jgi:hypothetical protein